MDTTDSAAPVFVLERDGACLTVRLSCPEKHNRLTADDLAALDRAFDGIDADPTLRVVVLAADGKTFCAGFDLAALGDGIVNGAAVGMVRLFEHVCNRLERLRPVTIAAISGNIYGGGTDLALACDFRIGVEGMELRVPASNFGIHYYAGGLRRFVARTGVGTAKAIFLTGERLTAERLLATGYLDELVPADTLAARVAELAERIATQAPNAVQGMKRALNDIANGTADMTAIAEASQDSLRSAEIVEGIAALKERRQPRFSP